MALARIPVVLVLRCMSSALSVGITCSHNPFQISNLLSAATESSHRSHQHVASMVSRLEAGLRLVEAAPIVHRVIECRIEHIMEGYFVARMGDAGSLVLDRDYRGLDST